MPDCEYCGKVVELPFRCNFCRGYFCMEHRLPENHDCPAAPPRTPLGSYQTKMALWASAYETKISLLASTVKSEPVKIGDYKKTETVRDYKKTETKTYGNIYGYHFCVPVEVYSDEKYREKLDKARTLDEVERIIRDYRKHHKQKAR